MALNISDKLKTTAQTIVNLKIVLSVPRLVVLTSPAPPNPAPRDAPLVWISINNDIKSILPKAM
jgi:hypothetical protein